MSLIACWNLGGGLQFEDSLTKKELETARAWVKGLEKQERLAIFWAFDGGWK